ncbi:MAG: hypothetical protein KAJ98_06090, partial [Spirochaetaceae bacterium]|nr:hypothetical protein [Spirochaetaceae bacterium]
MGERLFSSRFVFQALLLLLLSAGCLSAESTELQFGAIPPGERWTITTRWDYRVRIDGRYIGHTSRELREVYERQQEVPAGWLVDGDARILGATKKDGYPVAARLESSESISFILGINGAVMDAGDSFPRLRGFPTFPEGEIQQGDQWEAPLDVLISGPDGERAVLPQTASYRYLGRKPYMGEEAHYFEVLWAIRYKGYNPDIDMFLEQVEGSHRVSLVVDAETGVPIMARDNMKEIWSWADSRTEERDGFALIFWDGLPPLDTGGIRREFENRFPGEVTGAIVVGETNAGGEEESGVSSEGERAGS